MAKATKAQIAARKKFAATYGGKKSPKRPDAENPRRRKTKRKPRRRANPAVAAPVASENPRKRRAKRAKRRDNTWKGAPRAHGKASKKGWGKRRSGGRTSRGTMATRPYAARRSGVGGSGPGYGRDNPRRRTKKRRNNSWYGEPRRHAKAAKKGARRAARRRSARRRDNPARGITVHTHMHGQAPMDNPKRRRKSRRRSNPAGYAPNYVPTSVRQGLLDNPTYSGLFENPNGPFSKDSLIAFGVASAGVGLGLLFARGIDRFVATMKPADSKNGIKANHPWYGKNAVAMINSRPGALRLGVQAGGAVLGIGGAYMLRNKAIAPWLLGGMALGFGSNLLLQLAEWYAMPYLLKVKDPGEKTIANRLYALEQIDVQDSVDLIREDWATKPALNANQDQNNPVVYGPLNSEPQPSTAYLGRAGGMIGAPRKFVPDGRVGHCNSCGGDGGHYSGCSDCAICNGGGGGTRQCVYTVRSADRIDLYALAQASGTDIGTIAAMNGGGSPDQWWFEGNRVTLPESVCRLIEQGTPTTPPAFSQPPPSMFTPPTSVPGAAPLIQPITGIPEKLPIPVTPAASPFQNASVAAALSGAED